MASREVPEPGTANAYANLLQIKGGIPNDPRFPDRRDQYLDELEKETNRITQWLEDFRSKYSSHDEAQSIITEVTQALQSYTNTIGL